MGIVSFLLVFAVSNKLMAHAELQCMDEMNQPTDWYAAYKLPKIETEPSSSPLGQGEAYAYLNTKNSKNRWILSEKTISSSNSILANTLEELYKKKNLPNSLSCTSKTPSESAFGDSPLPKEQDVTYLMYNDESAVEDAGTTTGHTKGVIAFDSNSGFWLVHSIPKFPPENSYDYPKSGREYGQSILCITFKTEQLNEIAKQLLYNHPNIYAKAAQKNVIDGLDEDAKSLFGEKPMFIRKAPFSRTATLKSAGKMSFKSFAKDNQFGADLYDKIVGPGLEASLLVETWRRGKGTPMTPSCSTKYHIEDIKAINITVSNGSKTSKSIGFLYTEDHSKWSVTKDSNSKWVCIGDINRMESQWRRGGGTVCFNSSPAWSAYKSVVAGFDSC